MYRSLVLARVRQRSWRLQEIDVVRNYERIQLQGHFHVVQVRKSERKCFYAQTFEPRYERVDIAAGLHHRTDEKE